MRGISEGAAMNILETDGVRLLASVRALLEQKGIVSTAEVQERMAITDAASPGQGARMVAKAWVDPDGYKKWVAAQQEKFELAVAKESRK